MIFLTRDTHRDFDRIVEFCEEYETTEEDILIILGDASINYFLDDSDYVLKQELSQLPITLFSVHGNPEEYPPEIPSYQETEFHGGVAYWEPEFPNLIFARDGEIYDFDGKSVIILGGAYSIDKTARIEGGSPWFPSEQPDEASKQYAESVLERAHWQVDVVLSHAAPLSYVPRELFLPGLNPHRVDRSTEEWLDGIERRLSYDRWYCGHYHGDLWSGPVRVVYEDILELD